MKEFADPTQSAHTAGPVETAAAHVLSTLSTLGNSILQNRHTASDL